MSRLRLLAVKASVEDRLRLLHHLRSPLAMRQHRSRMLSRRLCLLAQRQLVLALPLKVQVLPLIRPLSTMDLI